MTALRRVALWVLGVGSAVVGVWALAAPRSFYDDFPGFGRAWVSVDGPYNEHLVRDVGALNLALAFAAFAAIVTASLLVARVAGGAALIFGVPHLAYHLVNLGDLEAGDAVGVAFSLTVNVLAALVALAAPAPEAQAGGAART